MGSPLEHDPRRWTPSSHLKPIARKIIVAIVVMWAFSYAFLINEPDTGFVFVAFPNYLFSYPFLTGLALIVAIVTFSSLMNFALPRYNKGETAETNGSGLSKVDSPDVLDFTTYRERIWVALILPVLVFVVWQGWSFAGFENTLFASPQKVWASLIAMMRRGVLWDALASSMVRALAGFTLGALIGLTLGVLNGLFYLSERLTDTTIRMIHAIPSLAVVPLFIIWFGIGELSKILLIAFATFSIVYISTFQSIRNNDPRLLEMARTQRLGALATIRHVILPGATPGILDGIRYALSVTWFVLIAAETIGTDSGIGFLAAQARDYLNTGLVFLCVLIYAVIGLLSDLILRHFRQQLLRWHPAQRNALQKSF